MAATPRVAYLGPAGTNTEVAALTAYAQSELTSCATIFAVARAVQAGEVDLGVVPIENSLQGTITDTVDLLIRDEGLAIRGEIILDIEHCLMVKPGAPRSDCRQFRFRNGARAVQHPCSSLIASVFWRICMGSGRWRLSVA